MSTIFGKCNKVGHTISHDEIELMQDAMSHWDADAVHTWIGPTAAMGHLMLYNTPESLYERLPLHDDVSGLTITADVRIDNREELYSMLRLNSPGERKLPDSTILLLLFKKYGEQCVQYLIGDFAFAIWDERRQQLFCARDHMGVRPLVYTLQPEFFAFASEKKGLLCLPQLDKRIDKEYYCNCLFLSRLHAPDTTLYQQIKRLPPAHSLKWNAADNTVVVRRYWDLDADKEITLKDEAEYGEGLRAHLETAVKCRVRSHYPAGTELSGGLDSSVITSMAHSFLRKEGSGIITFSNRLGEADEAVRPDIPHEHRYIDAVLQFNRISDAVFVTRNVWDDPLAEVDFMLRVNDGLETRRSAVMLPVKHAAMQRGVRALLSGFPGDELVTYRGQFSFLSDFDNGRYYRYFTAKTELPFNKLKPFLPERISFLGHRLRNMLSFTDRTITQACKVLRIPPKELFHRGDLAWTDQAYVERYKSYRHYQKYRLLKLATSMRLEGESRMGIPLKVETRFPMADIRLTQFCLSMPNKLKSGGDIQRATYRKAMARYLPEEVLRRSGKQGNMVPFKAMSDAKVAIETEIENAIRQLNSNGTGNYDVLLKLMKRKFPIIWIKLDVLKWLQANTVLVRD